MSTNFFFPQFIAPMGGCPSPWACGAYPKAGHVLYIPISYGFSTVEFSICSSIFVNNNKKNNLQT